MVKARCVCGHPADMHEHFRRGNDCSECSRWTCPKYVPLDRRDKAALTPSQRVALAESDAHMWRNLAALAEFSGQSRLAPTIPQQRRRSLTVVESMTLRLAQERARRQKKGSR